MITGGTLTPAFGRQYTNKASILKDLNEGRDFMMNRPDGGGYCSIKDLGDGYYQVRDHTLSHVWGIKVKNGVAS